MEYPAKFKSFDYKLKVKKSEAEYQGQIMENGLPEGVGRITSDEGLYEGEHEDTTQHGFGRQIFLNGDVYQGNWMLGKMYGAGTLTDKSGIQTIKDNWGMSAGSLEDEGDDASNPINI
jgi:hypothetical protein